MPAEVFHHDPGTQFTTSGGSHTPGDFIWHLPQTALGAQNAFRCAQTGMLSGGEFMVNVDGLMFDVDFAPDSVSKD